MTNSDDLIEGLMDNLRPGPLCLDLTFTPQDRQLNIVMSVNIIKRFLKKNNFENISTALLPFFFTSWSTCSNILLRRRQNIS